MKNNGKSYLDHLKPQGAFRVIVYMYVLGLIVFAAGRLFFQLSLSDLIHTQPTNSSDLWMTYIRGIQFDQVAIIVALIPLLLVLPFTINRKTVRSLSSLYLTAVFSLFVITLIIDMHYYRYFETHLNFLALDYLSEGQYVRNLIYAQDNFIWYILFWVILSIVFYFALTKLLNRWSKHNKLGLRAKATWIVIMLALMILGIRGRIDRAPLDWGNAYFSKNHHVNQMVLNGVYTFFKNFNETSRDPRLSRLNEPDRFQFVPTSEALHDIQTLLAQPHTTYLEPEKNLLRETVPIPNQLTDRYPNIVLIIMESWAGMMTGALDRHDGITPRFDSLANNGILFTNFYANGFRTSYGLAALLCSYPSLPGRSIMKRYDADNPFISFPQLLHSRGYYNLFLYGGDIAFDNMEGFFRSQKYDLLLGERDFEDSLSFSKWGVPDHRLFNEFCNMTDSLPRPFQATILTLSNHEPYDLPDSSILKFDNDSYTAKQMNALVYADHALGMLIDSMRHKSVFDSTLFVFVSDHARMFGSDIINFPRKFHIPLLFYAPGIIGDSAVRVETFGSQVDFLPTIMSLLGQSYTHESWGRDLLAIQEGERGFAVLNHFDKISWLDAEYLYSEQLGRQSYWYKNEHPLYHVQDTLSILPVDFLQRQTALHRYMQLAEQLSLPEPLQP